MPTPGTRQPTPPPEATTAADAGLDEAMRLAVRHALDAPHRTSPNPKVGAVVLDAEGAVVGVGVTEPPGGRHAEIVALDQAAGRARGGTVVTTLEPCDHQGRTPPCTQRIIAEGVARVAVGTVDPDPLVAGRGLTALRAAGIEVVTDVAADAATHSLAAYLHHRRTDRPYVVVKMAGTLDGAAAAPDRTSQWITGIDARRDAHALRAASDAICVGAGTVRADDPSLTVRHVEGEDPRRIVVGSAPAEAKVHPCTEWDGPLVDLLDCLAAQGVVQLLVEGGPRLAASFHEAGLVDRYVTYLAPALLGGGGGVPVLDGTAAPTIGGIWRGRIDSVRTVGDDLRIDVVPLRTGSTSAPNPQPLEES